MSRANLENPVLRAESMPPGGELLVAEMQLGRTKSDRKRRPPVATATVFGEPTTTTIGARSATIDREDRVGLYWEDEEHRSTAGFNGDRGEILIRSKMTEETVQYRYRDSDDLGPEVEIVDAKGQSSTLFTGSQTSLRLNLLEGSRVTMSAPKKQILTVRKGTLGAEGSKDRVAVDVYSNDSLDGLYAMRQASDARLLFDQRDSGRHTGYVRGRIKADADNPAALLGEAGEGILLGPGTGGLQVEQTFTPTSFVQTSETHGARMGIELEIAPDDTRLVVNGEQSLGALRPGPARVRSQMRFENGKFVYVQDTGDMIDADEAASRLGKFEVGPTRYEVHAGIDTDLGFEVAGEQESFNFLASQNYAPTEMSGLLYNKLNARSHSTNAGLGRRAGESTEL